MVKPGSEPPLSGIFTFASYPSWNPEQANPPDRGALHKRSEPSGGNCQQNNGLDESYLDIEATPGVWSLQALAPEGRSGVHDPSRHPVRWFVCRYLLQYCRQPEGRDTK